MGWIKRNLFFAVGGAVALVLLGAGGFYIFQSWARDAAASAQLNELYASLKNLKSQSPAPGNDKVNNTETAKQQQREIEQWIASTSKYFKPIPAIPAGNVTSEAFASALRKTVDLLQREAQDAGVILPPKYDFSFSAQRPLVKFATGSLEPLAAQLGDIKVISECVFSARVNALDSIQRARVSADDINGSQGDYTDRQATTNDLAVLTPYIVTFRCFTPDFAGVISAFAASPSSMIIKKINIQPASMAASAFPGADPSAMMHRQFEGEFDMPPGYMPGQVYAPGQAYMPTTPTAGQPMPRGGPQAVLKEQLLRVTMEVEVIKLLPKS